MRVNRTKTKEIIMNFSASNRVAETPLLTIHDEPTERVTHATVLGVIITSDLTWNAPVNTILRKGRQRLYMMYQLKRSGVSQEDLLGVYSSVIRSVIEYACQAWHSNLPQYLSHELEPVQKRGLKAIYLREYLCNGLAGSGTNDALYELCKSYFNKMLNPDHELHHCCPRKESFPMHYERIIEDQFQSHVPIATRILLSHGV